MRASRSSGATPPSGPTSSRTVSAAPKVGERLRAVRIGQDRHIGPRGRDERFLRGRQIGEEDALRLLHRLGDDPLPTGPRACRCRFQASCPLDRDEAPDPHLDPLFDQPVGAGAGAQDREPQIEPPQGRWIAFSIPARSRTDPFPFPPGERQSALPCRPPRGTCRRPSDGRHAGCDALPLPGTAPGPRSRNSRVEQGRDAGRRASAQPANASRTRSKNPFSALGGRFPSSLRSSS